MMLPHTNTSTPTPHTNRIIWQKRCVLDMLEGEGGTLYYYYPITYTGYFQVPERPKEAGRCLGLLCLVLGQTRRRKPVNQNRIHMIQVNNYNGSLNYLYNHVENMGR